MTHPIFRTGPYPFWRAEATTRHRRLVERFNRPQDVVRLYRSTDDGLPELFPGQSVDLLWQEALQNLAPAGLLRRLTEVVRAEGSLGVLAEAIAAVAAAKPLVDQGVAADEVLVINRENLRDLLGRVGSDDHPTKVVFSSGEKKSQSMPVALFSSLPPPRTSHLSSPPSLSGWPAGPPAPTPGNQSHDAG